MFKLLSQTEIYFGIAPEISNVDFFIFFDDSFLFNHVSNFSHLTSERKKERKKERKNKKTGLFFARKSLPVNGKRKKKMKKD